MRLTVLSVAYPLAPVAPATAGGAEQVLLQLDRALVAKGHRSIVVACSGSHVASTLIATPAMQPPFDENTKQLARAHHRAAIQKALHQFSVDLVHMHGIDFYGYLPSSGVPALVTLHLPISWYPPEALRVRRPDTYFHCVSRAQQRTAPPDLPLLRPIECGVDSELLAPASRKGNFALFLGRICSEKGVHLAVQAAQRAKVPLIIAGQAFGYDEHLRYFRERVVPALGRNCRFVGPVGPRQKRRLLAYARCLLLPSLAQETCGLVAREALAAGTPVIAFARGALPETIQNGRTGFLVSDVEEMAHSILDATAIEPRICRAEARRLFPLSTMIDRYLQVYRELAGARLPAQALA